MAKKATNKPEAVAAAVDKKEVVEIVYTPEQREEALKAKVSQEVSKLPVVDQKLAELREKYKGLVIAGVDDKKGFELVKAGISELTGLRSATKRKADEITQDFKDVVKGVNGEAKRIIDEIAEIEQPLRAEKQRIEDEREAAKKAAEEEAQRKLDERITGLKNVGLAFDGSFYVLGNISVDLATIKKMPEDKYIILVSKAQEEANRLEQERLEEERIREEERKKAAEEKERLEKERLELERQRAEQAEQIRKQQEELAKQKAEHEAAIKKQQQELEKMKHEAAERAKELERQKIEATAARIGYKLEALGMRRVSDVYDYFDNVIGAGVKYEIKAALDLQNEDDITALISTLEHQVNALKDKRQQHDKELEDKRKAEEEAKKAEEARLAKEKEEARLALLPDVDKALEMISKVAVTIPMDFSTVSNEVLRKQLAVTFRGINNSLADLKKSVETFVK